MMVYAAKFVLHGQLSEMGTKATRGLQIQKPGAVFYRPFKIQHLQKCRDAASYVRACWTTDFGGVTPHANLAEPIRK